MRRKMNKAQKAEVLAQMEVDLDRVRNQSLEEDIKTIEKLYGTRYIPLNATADDVKRQALMQVKGFTLECINGTA